MQIGEKECIKTHSFFCFYLKYRFASRWDQFLLLIGLFTTFVKSCSWPFLILIYGEFTTLLVDRTYGIGTSTPTLVLEWFGGGKILWESLIERIFFNVPISVSHRIIESIRSLFPKWRTNATDKENHEELLNDSIAFLIASIVETVIQLIAGAICVDCFNQTAISQVTRIRIKYFASLMRQDIGWYDTEKGNSNFTVRLAE